MMKSANPKPRCTLFIILVVPQLMKIFNMEIHKKKQNLFIKNEKHYECNKNGIKTKKFKDLPKEKNSATNQNWMLVDRLRNKNQCKNAQYCVAKHKKTATDFSAQLNWPYNCKIA